MNEVNNDTRIPVRLFLKVFFRTFTLQGSWNFERMQNIGFLFIVAPILRFFYKDGKELMESFNRHHAYFNTHPFLASPIIGSVIRLEESRNDGQDLPVDAHDFKTMTMAPYAAMGDALFWGGLRPLAAGVALFFAVKGSLWAPVVFLLIFNIPHLWLRISGFFLGYSRGLGVAEIIKRCRLPDIAIRLKEGTVILFGALCAYLIYVPLRGTETNIGWGMAVLPFVVFSGWLTRRGASTLLVVLLASAFSIALLHFG